MPGSILMAAAVVFLSYGGIAHADRPLLEDGETHATLLGSHDCGQTVSLGVDSTDPDLFASGSAALQRVVDGAVATLLFECDELREVRIEGRLKGLQGKVFQGVARVDADWRVAAMESIHGQVEPVQLPHAPGAEPRTALRADDGAAQGFRVVDLSLGMQVGDARQAVVRNFGIEPRYDMAQGRMTLLSGGCPPDFDWKEETPKAQAGCKRLEARFTDQRDARLYRVELVQVLDGTDSTPVTERLIQRFGPPVAQWIEPGPRSKAPRPGTEMSRLAWGEVVDAQHKKGRPLHVLEAVVMARGGALVTVVELYDPSLQPGWVEAQPAAGSDFKL